MMRLEILATLSAAALVCTTTAASADPKPISCLKPDASYATRSLGGGGAAPRGEPIFRFVQLSDVHIYDDDGSPVFSGSELEPALEPTIANGSAQRLQDEYTDEVLNAMIATINACHSAETPIELMIATGDNTDTMTLNETRRFIDNLDGVSARDTAYESNCGYVTVDSNENAKLGALPCTPEMQAAFAVPTGKLVADSEARPPDPESPTDQFMPTRSPRQNVDATASSALGLSLHIAPGLPQSLRCDATDANCGNLALETPYYAVFGNHDGAVRGTVTMQRPFQAGTAAYGRYFLQSQREWINEFFFTEPAPGPVGHGFGHAGTRLDDPDDRNDGYYSFDAAAGAVRMIVLNTLYDGVRNELHRKGQTNTDTAGLVAGNEITNPIGLEQGVMDEDQYQWLKNELTRAGDRPVLVFSHHPDRSFTERRLGFAADGGRTADEVDELLGEHPGVVAWIAGHTHENVIRPCTAAGCSIGGSGTEPDSIGHGFWRIETASLIDYPQEGRIIELYDLCRDDEGEEEDDCSLSADERWALRLTMIRPDPNDVTAELSRRLAIREATCNVSQMLGGSLSSGPYDQGRLETVVTNAGEAAVQQKFCFGEASLSLAEGSAGDRDVVLLP